MFTDDKAPGETHAAPPSAPRVCADAAAYLRRYGHTKSSLGYLRAPVCAIGAISAVIYGDPRSEARHEIGLEYQVVRLMGFASAIDLIMWNNAPRRTCAEVIACFEAGAREELV